MSRSSARPPNDQYGAVSVEESEGRDNFPSLHYDLFDTLEADMMRLLRSGDGSDVHFESPGESRPYLSHSSVVAARCPNLRDEVISFLQHAQDTQSRSSAVVLPLRIKLPYASHEALSQVLRFIYTGRIDVGAFDVLYDELLLAAWFGLTSLEQCILDYLSDGDCYAQDVGGGVDHNQMPNTHQQDEESNVSDKHNCHVECAEYDKAHLIVLSLCLDRALHADTRAHFAHEEAETQRHVTRVLTECVAPRCARLIQAVPVNVTSWSFVHHVLAQEGLDVSEEALWEWVVRCCCAEFGIVPEKRVSQMNASERARVRERLRQVCSPDTEEGIGEDGRRSRAEKARAHAWVRVLDFGAEFFSQEVEASGALHSREALMKYRFDALVDELGVTALSSTGIGESVVAFGGSWDEFMSRVRRRCVTCECNEHPVRGGYNVKGEVAFACWVRALRVEFDHRSAIDRYADVEFFADEECTARLFSFSKWEATELGELGELGRMDRRRAASKRGGGGGGGGGRVRGLRNGANRVVTVDGRRFWYSFYSPHLIVVEEAWGFRFTTSVAR